MRIHSGTVPNLKFSFTDAHPRHEAGGWAREVTERELPVAKTLAGVNMLLEPGAVRELHWHKQAEWSYMLDGRARITALDRDGHPFLDDVGVGDLWYFPAGIPHSIQGLEEGCEFLLVFDDGGFSEHATFLVCDWLAHTPPHIVAANLGLDADELPDGERYIFPAQVPGPQERRAEPGFSFPLLSQPAQRTPAGAVRIADSTNFHAATTVAAALVDVEPGGLRELHWHPDADEWQYFIAGEGRMTVFAAGASARTFDYRARDVGYVPQAMGHYVENTGSERLRFLELFRSDRFSDVSLEQWLASTPAALVAAHLGVAESALRRLSPQEQPVM
jgi:oxalate decarboxylase